MQFRVYLYVHPDRFRTSPGKISTFAEQTTPLYKSCVRQLNFHIGQRCVRPVEIHKGSQHRVYLFGGIVPILTLIGIVSVPLGHEALFTQIRVRTSNFYLFGNSYHCTSDILNVLRSAHHGSFRSHRLSYDRDNAQATKHKGFIISFSVKGFSELQAGDLQGTESRAASIYIMHQSL